MTSITFEDREKLFKKIDEIIEEKEVKVELFSGLTMYLLFKLTENTYEAIFTKCIIAKPYIIKKAEIKEIR